MKLHWTIFFFALGTINGEGWPKTSLVVPYGGDGYFFHRTNYLPQLAEESWLCGELINLHKPGFLFFWDIANSVAPDETPLDAVSSSGSVSSGATLLLTRYNENYPWSPQNWQYSLLNASVTWAIFLPPPLRASQMFALVKGNNFLTYLD